MKRKLLGIVEILKWLYCQGWVWLVIFLLFVMCSCASHREVCGVTEEIGDSLSMVIEQGESKTVEVRDSDVAVSNMERVDSTHAESSYTEEETVNEQIIETEDSLGNKTKTTNRTSTKKKTGAESMTNVDRLRQQEEWLAVHLSRMDSLVQKYLEEEMKHRESRDSMKEIKERQPIAQAVTQPMTVALRYAVAIGVIVLMVAVVRYFEKRKNK